MVKILTEQRRKEAKERNKAKVRRNKRMRYCALRDTMVYEMRCNATINSPPCKHLGWKGCNLAKKKRACPKLPKIVKADGSQKSQTVGYGKCLKCAEFDKENDQCKLKKQKKQEESIQESELVIDMRYLSQKPESEPVEAQEKKEAFPEPAKESEAPNPIAEPISEHIEIDNVPDNLPKDQYRTGPVEELPKLIESEKSNVTQDLAFLPKKEPKSDEQAELAKEKERIEKETAIETKKHRKRRR